MKVVLSNLPLQETLQCHHAHWLLLNLPEFALLGMHGWDLSQFLDLHELSEELLQLLLYHVMQPSEVQSSHARHGS
jgi:hypothetical protein